MLNKSTIENLATILKEEYDLDCTPEEALEIGQTLTGYFDALSKFNFQDNPNETK